MRFNSRTEFTFARLPRETGDEMVLVARYRASKGFTRRRRITVRRHEISYILY